MRCFRWVAWSARGGGDGGLRWEHATHGFVGPGDSILMAEETGLIVGIGAWVVREACRQMIEWWSMGLLPPSVAVNCKK